MGWAHAHARTHAHTHARTHPPPPTPTHIDIHTHICTHDANTHAHTSTRTESQRQLRPRGRPSASVTPARWWHTSAAAGKSPWNPRPGDVMRWRLTAAPAGKASPRSLFMSTLITQQKHLIKGRISPFLFLKEILFELYSIFTVAFIKYKKKY